MKLAKGKKETTVKAPVIKKVEEVIEKVLSPEEERDLKTKAKVEELLDGVEMTLKTEEEKKEEILEIAPEPDSKDVNWLEEQVSKLSEENERYYVDLNRDYFNLQMKTLFEDCIDFVSMHYANNKRPGKFWDYVRNTFKPSERMLHQIDELNNPDIAVPRNSKHNYMFGGSNWMLMLYQLGYPMAPRDLMIPDEIVLEKLVKNYQEYAKNRHIWSRGHSAEIDRIHEISKL